MEGSMTIGVFALPSSLIQAIEFFTSTAGKGTHMQPGFSGMDIDSFVLHQKLAKTVKISSTLQFAMDLKKLSNRELLDHCLRTDDQAGWSEFLERITPTIAGVVYKRLSNRGWPDPGRVQDLVHDTLLKLFDKDKAALRKFEWRHENAIHGYAKVIARHVVDDCKPTKEDGEDEIEKAIDVTGSSEADLFAKLKCAEIERCLEKLDANPLEKDIFWLFYRHRYTAREISEMPGVNLDVKRVETILARLVRQLRVEMKQGRAGSASSE